ncbi:MAG: 7-cyano-7-deazaguanine synthase [Acidobacteriota bacterium]|nr:7-cyano-7-deazaguanine synthase [Acidobacteriota bacterium]
MTLVLLSGGLDSAVLLSHVGSTDEVTPVHVRSGYAWELAEAHCIRRLMLSGIAPRLRPLQTISSDMRDITPEGHWALTGIAPAYHTADEAVYLEGRNIMLLSKAAVLASRMGITTIAMGLLKGNPFPDATPAFLTAIGRALSLGLAHEIQIVTPLSTWTKADVVKEARRVGLPLDLTISCMAPIGGRHCGTCSKCRERHDGFVQAGVEDPTDYANRSMVDLGGPKPN